MLTFYDSIGLVGITFTVLNYALLQMRRDYAKDIRYSAGNLMGSVLLGFSLIEKWNPAAFTVTAIMAVISLYGVFRCLKYTIRAQQIEKMIKSRL